MMKIIAIVGLGLLVIPLGTALAACPKNIDYSLRPLALEETVHLCEQYAGKVLVLVNTAGVASSERFPVEPGWREFAHHILYHFPISPRES